MNVKYIQHIPQHELVSACEQVVDQLYSRKGLEVVDYYEDGKGDAIYEDDGVLHITRGKIRVAVDVSGNQNLGAKEQKANERAVLEALKNWSVCDHSDERVCQGLGH